MNKYQAQKYLEKGSVIKLICECDFCKENDIVGRSFLVDSIDYERKTIEVKNSGTPSTLTLTFDIIELLK